MSGESSGIGGRVSSQWNSFLEFLYNPRDGTVLGRTGKSWAKILVFYMFYYGFLAALFAISLSIVRGSLDDYTPIYQTRLQTPGVAIQPKISSDIEQTSNIMYNYKTKGEEYNRLVNQITKFLYDYSPENQTTEYGFQTCDRDGKITNNQRLTPGQTVPACSFDKSLLGPCGTAPYGYDEGKPCLYIKLNRIIGWVPVAYTNLDEATGFPESGAPNLADLLSAYSLSFKPYLLYGACYGYTAEDEAALNRGGKASAKYYPNDMGLPFVYYPYLGNRRQLNYTNPIIAVQFTNVTLNTKIDMACKVYAKNVLDNREMGEGYFRFDLKVDG